MEIHSQKMLLLVSGQMTTIHCISYKNYILPKKVVVINYYKLCRPDKAMTCNILVSRHPPACNLIICHFIDHALQSKEIWGVVCDFCNLLDVKHAQRCKIK